jgi:hypothetical protein
LREERRLTGGSVLVVWILLAVLTGLLALLAVPLDLTFSVQRHQGRQETSAILYWLFGLVRLRLGKPKARVRTTTKRPKAGQRRRKRGRGHGMLAMLRSEGFGRRLLRLARDLLRRVHIHDLSMQVRLGLDDPADTGRLWAVVGPLSALLPLPPAARLAIEPDFTSEALDLNGKGRIRIIPIQLLFMFLGFVLSPTTLRALHTMRAEAS